jgi:pilus assembly protein TadC
VTASAWLCLATALALWPARRRDGRAAPPSAGAPSAGRGGRAFAAAAGVGIACLAVGGPVGGGVAAGLLGPLAAWLAGRPGQGRAGTLDPALPLVLDLAAAALRSGRTLPDALDGALPAAGDELRSLLQQVAGLLRLGAEPARAWAVAAADPDLATVAAAAVRSASSGLRVALTLERQAGELRATAATRAATRAQHAGVTVLAPLGACFLPAFVCLGIVPVVAGLAASSFGGLR